MLLKQRIITIILILSFNTSGQFGFERIDTIDVYQSALLKKYPWAGGLDYGQFSNIDLNFDGVKDLFVFDRTNHKVLTFLQTGTVGSPNFVYAPEYESKFPEYPNFFDAYEDEKYLFNWVLLVDYNCDGKEDIFASRSGGIKVFKNTGNASTGLSFQNVSLRLKSWQYNVHQYIYVSSADLPGLKDIDDDGDVDILTFGGTGQAIEYHKNLSMETYGHCDSLLFEMKNTCWGRFRESATTNGVTLWDTLEYPCDGLITNPEHSVPFGSGDRHTGSAVLPIDLNGNGVMDLILGDIAYSSLVMLMNSGTSPNLNSGMNAVDNFYPSSDISADVTIFPGAYHADVNHDGKRDLIVTPSSKVGSENRFSTWYYLNTGTDLAPVFDFQQNDFMQGEMIDVGTKAFPVFFDHDGDGLKDLLVSTQGHFDPGSGNQKASIYYYRNTGTLANPEFTFVTSDYLNLSTLGIGASLYFYPTFGDLDIDGDEDMILGEYNGYCYYFENTGGAGNTAIFSTYVILENYAGDPLVTPDNAGISIIPKLVDLDRDDDLDLVVGRRNGKLNYYENIGSASSFSFLYLTNHLGDVNVAEYWSIEGYAVPEFLDINGAYKLVVGSKTGYLHLYDDIEGNISGSFNAVDSTVDNVNIGTYAAPAIYDLNDDNRFEMVLGNERGGVGLFKSANISNIGLIESHGFDLKIYPNPAKDLVQINITVNNQFISEMVTVNIVDLSGRLIATYQTHNGTLQLNVDEIYAGNYFVQVQSNHFSLTQKLIIY